MSGILQGIGESLNNEQMGQLKQGHQIAMTMIYDERIFQAIMEDIQSLPPEQGIGQSIVMVLSKVQEQVGPLDMLTATSLGIAMLSDLIEAIQQVGIQMNQEQITTAFQVAVQLWLAENGGQYSQEQVMGALQSMGGQPQQQAQHQSGGILEGIQQ